MVTTMPKMTISEVSRQFNVPRSTIYKKMEDGDLSYSMDGKRRIVDPSEAERCFPSDRPKIKRRKVSKDNNGLHVETVVDSSAMKSELEYLKLHVTTLEGHIKSLQDDKNDLRRRLDEADSYRSLVVRLIEDKSSKQDKPKKEKEEKSYKTGESVDVEGMFRKKKSKKAKKKGKNK